MPLLPVALYGLEVPPGDIIPAIPDFSATFRITMAAIDPTMLPEIDDENPSAPPRATLKLIRQPIGASDEDNDEYLKAMLGGSDSEEDSEDDSDEEEVNGGPSDPAKSKKAQKEAALKQLMEAMKAESDEEMEDVVGNGLSAKAKGKAPATGEDEDDSSEDSEDLDVEEFVICTLDPERTYQQALDITIAEDERVFFKVTGSHTIYLTGNYVMPDDNGHNHRHEVYDSDEESEDEDYDLSPSEDELGLDGEESDELDELDGLDDPRITELNDDEEEEVPKLVFKDEKKGKNKRSAAALEEGESLDDLVSKSIKGEPSEDTPKLSKKQLKKLKNNKGDAVETKVEESKENVKGDKKVQFAKNLEQGPTGSTPDKSAANGKPKSALGVKEVNGVKIDDKKLGSGPGAKSGNRLEMRYIGKFADGKVFDSNKKGKPFAFKLGKGEVIKGWDIGLAGMQIGGERRLIIPAHLAYGSNPPPGMAKNATLTFDVKLLSIK